tara:strand:+ start:755 stop:1027 length:273 start_codon:yes stop_codon:yes gene_type:complete
MALTKKTSLDRIEIVKIQDHFSIQVREKIAIFEGDKEISFSYNRYVLNPDADIETITDEDVKKQFKTTMTAKVKKAYNTFHSASEAIVSK